MFKKGKTQKVQEERKVKTEPLISFDDDVVVNKGVTVIGNKIKNVDTVYDLILRGYEDLNEQFLQGKSYESLMLKKLDYSDEIVSECANRYMQNRNKLINTNVVYSMIKEVLDCIYSISHNQLIYPLNDIGIIATEKILMFTNLRKSLISLMLDSNIPSIINTNYYEELNILDVVTNEYCMILKQIIVTHVAGSFYDYYRDVVYNTELSDIKLRSFSSNISLSNDAVWFTVQGLIRNACISIDSTLDIILKKHLYDVFQYSYFEVDDTITHRIEESNYND